MHRHLTRPLLLFVLGASIAGACLPVADEGDDRASETSAASVGKTKAGSSMVAFQTVPVVDAEVVVRGDFDGDGGVDYAVGDWRYDRGAVSNAGRVLVYPTTGCGEVPHHSPAQIWTPGVAGLPGPPVLDGRFGYALTAADFNADGFDDLAVGMPGIAGTAQTHGGSAYILYGSSSGLTAAGVFHLSQNSPGILEVVEGGDGFAHSLTSADFNGDGYADLAVGVPFEGRHGHSQSGAVQVIHGSASGLTGAGDQLFDRQSSSVTGVARSGDHFGYSVAAGRFSSSGSTPGLAIGVPGADDAAWGAGAVHVLPSSSSGLTGWGSARFHESSPGISSTANAGESFGHALEVRDDDGDGADDLLIQNAFGSDCNDAATHLLYGSDSGVTATGDQYTCGTATAPRFALPVEAPQRPTSYTPPAGDLVKDVNDLVQRLSNDIPEVIILDDGVYDHPHVVRPGAADEVWALNLGAAVLQFGIYYNRKSWPDDQQPALHGLTFDMAVVDYGRVASNGTANAAIVLAGVQDSETDLATAVSLRIEDTFFYGHDWIDAAVVVRRPDELTLRRLVVRDTHDAGLSIENVTLDPEEGENAISPMVTVEDIDVAGVAKPAGEAGSGQSVSYPGSNYYCRHETGITINGIDEVQVHRLRLRDTRCAGLNLGINREEVSFDAGDVTDVDIDCAGFGPPTLADDGAYRPVRNGALYMQFASELEVSHVVIGPNTHDGLRSEYSGGERNEGDVLHHALIQSRRAGISWDACSFLMVAANSVIENATCAGVVDYYAAVEPSACGSPHLDAIPNTVTGVTFRLPDGVPAIKTDNANTCPLLPDEGYALIHKSDYGPFPENKRLTRGVFHGRDALVLTHDETAPEPLNLYNDIGSGPRDGLTDGGGREGILRFKIFCESNACWNGGGGKLLGLYGGNSAGGGTVAGVPNSGGCPSTSTLGLEGGWSSRIAFNFTNGNPAMYSYEQNRCEFGPGIVPPDTGNVFGVTRTLHPLSTLPENRWVQVEMAVEMNNPGQADGTLRLDIDGSTVTADGIMWQNDSELFGVTGMVLSYQWQGGETVTVNSSIGLSDFEFLIVPSL